MCSDHTRIDGCTTLAHTFRLIFILINYYIICAIFWTILLIQLLPVPLLPKDILTTYVHNLYKKNLSLWLKKGRGKHKKVTLQTLIP